VRTNAESTLNCALCPLLAVSCGDAGLALFTLSRLREWTIVCIPSFLEVSRLESPIVYVHTSTQITGQTRNITYSLKVTNPSRNGNVQIPGMATTHQYCIPEETKSRLSSGNDY
jgi:hypothetical protein